MKDRRLEGKGEKSEKGKEMRGKVKGWARKQ